MDGSFLALPGARKFPDCLSVTTRWLLIFLPEICESSPKLELFLGKFGENLAESCETLPKVR